MKTLLAAAAMLTALSAPAFAEMTPVGAGCTINDTSGNTLIYVFANNTDNGNNTGSSLLVGGIKNGIDDLPVGPERVWSYAGVVDDAGHAQSMVLTMQADPSWTIVATANGATLYHYRLPAGSGLCIPIGQDTVDLARANTRRAKIQANLPGLIDNLAAIARGIQGRPRH